MEKNQKPWSEKNFRLYNVGFKIAKFALSRKFDYEFHGLENIKEAPGIFAMNHQRFEDSVFLGMAYTQTTEMPLAIAAQSEYFQGHGVRNKNGNRQFGRAIKFFVNNVGAISVDRGGSLGSSRQTMDDVKRARDEGVSIGVHFDATRATKPEINKYHPFFTRLAVDLDMPLYSVGGLYTDMGPGNKERFDLTVSKPLDTNYYNSLPLKFLPKKMRIDHITTELEKMAALSTGLPRTHKFAEIPKIQTDN